MGILHRLKMMTSVGRVDEVIDEGRLQSLSVRWDEGDTSTDVPLIESYGLSARPPIGGEVIAFFSGGLRSNAVALIHSLLGKRPKDKAEGDVVLYSVFGDQVYLSKDGIKIKRGSRSEDEKEFSIELGESGAEVVVGDSKLVVPANGKLEITGVEGVSIKGAGGEELVASIKQCFDSLAPGFQLCSPDGKIVGAAPFVNASAAIAKVMGGADD